MRPALDRSTQSQDHGATAPFARRARGSIEVDVSDTQGHLQIDTESLADVVRRVLEGEGVQGGSVSIALVDDATIHLVNRRHLSHDRPTDVISFGLSDPGDPLLTGELVVSAERAVSMARQFGIAPQAELALYVVHGLLHLCGYNDIEDADVMVMRRREGEILAREGLANALHLVGPAKYGKRESARWSD